MLKVTQLVRVGAGYYVLASWPQSVEDTLLGTAARAGPAARSQETAVKLGQRYRCRKGMVDQAQGQ